MNCTIAQEAECVYDEKPQKPTKKSRSLKLDQTLDYLNNRLDRLESLLQSVARAIPGLDFKNGNNLEKHEVSSSNSGSEDDESSGDSPEQGREPSSSSGASGILDVTSKQNEIYLGNQSFFSILSKSSLIWMKNHLSQEDQHLLVPLINLPFAFGNKTKVFVNLWFEKKGCNNSDHLEFLKSPLPKNKEIIYDLVNKYITSCSSIQVLCLVSETYQLLEKYYSTKNPNKRKIQLIDLFKLSLAVLICLSDAMEALVDSSDATSASSVTSAGSPIKDLTPEEVSNMRDHLMQVCMGYYYQVSITGQGLETVKALLFFAAFLAKCYEPHEVIQMVLTQAIRKSLDMGLHRIETYKNCSQEEFEVRILVWRTACYIDMEICFRGGKPPIINHHDTSDELRNSFLAYKVSNKAYSSTFLKDYEMIFDVRLETYNMLFSATADTKTFATLEKNVDYLNDKMFGLLAQMEPTHRPCFFNQPGFHEVTSMETPDEEHKVIAQLTFFLNMMTINRLPMMFAYPGASLERLQVYRNLSLNSARTIMHMLRNFHAYGPRKAPSLWVTFYPLISVLHLLAACMSDPKSPDAHSDILLILEMCKTWFNRKLSPDSSRSFRFDMTVLLQVLVKSVTSIAISIFEKNTGIEIMGQDQSLKDSFEAPLKIFPELFGDPEALKNSISMVFESNSPFQSVGTPASQATPTYSNPGDGNTSTGDLLSGPSLSGEFTNQKATPRYGEFDAGTNFGGLENYVFDQLDEFPNFFFDGIGGGTGSL